MEIKKILVHNFRNLEQQNLQPDARLNIIIGKNGQGKTNFLEAIYLMANGESHRTSTTKEMINWNEKGFLVQILLFKNSSEIKISYSLKNRDRKIKINNNPVEKISDFIGNLNAVLFSPEDLKLVKGGPAQRRKFINTEISQVNSYYHHLLKKYNNILKQRNNLLKDIQQNNKTRKKNEDMIAVWDEQIAEAGSKIVLKRKKVINKIKILARLMQRRITGGRENLNLYYETDLKGETAAEVKNYFTEQLSQNRKKEFRLGYTTLGPHRDDIALLVNDRDIRKYGSQGQQRTTALALKMAELEFMKSEIGEYPVLLLDDVFSELDRERKKLLINLIRGRIQTFITSTEDEYIDILKKEKEVKIFRVQEGNFSLHSSPENKQQEGKG